MLAFQTAGILRLVLDFLKMTFGLNATSTCVWSSKRMDNFSYVKYDEHYDNMTQNYIALDVTIS